MSCWLCLILNQILLLFYAAYSSHLNVPLCFLYWTFSTVFLYVNACSLIPRWHYQLRCYMYTFICPDFCHCIPSCVNNVAIVPNSLFFVRRCNRFGVVDARQWTNKVHTFVIVTTHLSVLCQVVHWADTDYISGIQWYSNHARIVLFFFFFCLCIVDEWQLSRA